MYAMITKMQFLSKFWFFYKFFTILQDNFVSSLSQNIKISSVLRFLRHFETFIELKIQF